MTINNVCLESSRDSSKKQETKSDYKMEDYGARSQVSNYSSRSLRSIHSPNRELKNLKQILEGVITQRSFPNQREEIKIEDDNGADASSDSECSVQLENTQGLSQVLEGIKSNKNLNALPPKPVSNQI